MKKILTASLVAMMAVTAANAEIASTTYVSDQTGSTVAFKAGDFGTGIAKDATNLKAAVTAISDAVAGLSGDGTGSVSDQIESALSGATADDFSESVQASLSKADNSVQTGDFNTFKTENTQAIADAKQEAITAADTNADSKISAAKAAMTLTEKGGAGSFIQQVAQADGTVTATATAFVTTVDTTTKDSSIAPTTKAIKSYVDTQVGGTTTDLTNLQNTVTEQGAAIGNLTTVVNTNKTAAETALNEYKAEAANTFMDSAEVGAAITAAVTNSETGALKDYSTTEQMNTAIATAKGEAIADAKTETTNQVNALKNGQVQTNTTNISTITTNLGALNGVEIPAACATGRCALVMEGGEAKWETINY